MEPGLPLYRCDDVRAIDRAAIGLEGIDGYTLMTRAAAAALRLLRARWPQARRLCVACGEGNNGGDGYVLARLAREAGLAATVVVVDPPQGRTPESAQAQQAWADAGGERVCWSPEQALPEADLVVDALFGTGLDRAPRGTAAGLIETIKASGLPVLALDVPSGLDADRGCAPGVAIRATTTLAFVAWKRGLFTGRARELCGELALDTLGIPDAAAARCAPAARALRAGMLGRWLRPRARDAHKGSHGTVLVIGGEHGFGGAIRLCAEAALRSGTGLLRVATRAAHVAPILTGRPEAMVHVVDEAAALAPLLGGSPVLAIGPGLGTGTWGRALFEGALRSGLPLVVDADALNLLAQTPQALPAAVLTPHPGEAARLLGCDVAAIEQDRFAAAQHLATRYSACIVLKGAGSVVAAPGRLPVVIDAGNPGMATGGMGDVLTGVVAALRAQGLEPFDAACAGALLHAAAGDAAAASGGERGLLASDLFPHLRALANPE